jgi:energy-coupling factor transport system ATP-binding protein
MTIRARGLGWRYAGRPAPALRDVDLELEDGACLLVAGPSGSGKSTLALAIAGLIPHESAGTWSGELEVAGLSVPRTARVRLAEAAGVVFQEPAAQLVMETVEDDVAFGLENRAWPRPDMTARVGEVTAELGVGALVRRRTASLSGGEQQRVAIAGVLAPRPRVLVLDEPTSSLDPAASAAFYEALGRLRRRPDRPTVVLIEHRVDLALPHVDWLLALGADGRPLASGPAEATFRTSHDLLDRAGVWTPREAAARIARAVAAPAGRPPATGAVLVEARELGHRYDGGPPALEAVSLTIAPGERIALVGANGSGKSTLARLVAGLLRARAGTVRLAGDDPARLPARDVPRRAGYVFQDPAVQFVADRVAAELHVGLHSASEHAAADRLLAELELDGPGLREASPHTLSGGEQRRLSVACALVRDPALLVLDEPTYGLDRRRYEALLGLIRERVGRGTALLAATHDLVFAAEASERAVGLRDGRVAWDGRTAALLVDAGARAGLALA